MAGRLLCLTSIHTPYIITARVGGNWLASWVGGYAHVNVLRDIHEAFFNLNSTRLDSPVDTYLPYLGASSDPSRRVMRVLISASHRAKGIHLTN